MQIHYLTDYERFYLSLDSGDEYEVDVDYDYSPAEKGDWENPGWDAEFCITEVRLDNGFEIDLKWIDNLREFELEMIKEAK